MKRREVIASADNQRVISILFRTHEPCVPTFEDNLLMGVFMWIIKNNKNQK